MKTVTVLSLPGFDEWRAQARQCLTEKMAPHNIVWKTGAAAQDDLFGITQAASAQLPLFSPLNVSQSFLPLAQTACCHSDPDRFALLYRILWRLIHENRNLLKITTDDDILRLAAMVKAVRRDAYKITAFLRFREVQHDAEEYFVAWYEPEHYTLERVVPFFQTRFRNMYWSILTPYRAAHWNREDIFLEDNPDPQRYPREDDVEKYWLGYYASIFNPARIKKAAMLNQMPKKYWKMMPETILVPDLLRGADQRVKAMLEKENL